MHQTIEVQPGIDLEDLWNRFEIFEALHHSMRICNPMTSAQLDDVLDTIELGDRRTVLDLACGYGELLMRCAERRHIQGTGVDLSPWMIASAASSAVDRTPGCDLRWVLGEAAEFVPNARPDVAVCIGAEWVWHDFGGTVRALSDLVAARGVVVVGAARLHTAADPDEVRRERGVIETIDDQHDRLVQNGLVPVHRIDPDDAGWDAYLERTATAAHAWAARYPGPLSERWIAEQIDWHAARERDREIIGWSVWIARRA